MNKLLTKSSSATWGPLSLIFHILALALFHWLGYIGHYGFDDMHYAELAVKLLNGEINFQDHFSYRITLIGLCAFFYSIFGINDFASALPNLLACSWILIMMYKLLRKEAWYLIHIALSLCLFSQWFISYAGKLMPDMLLASFAFWSIYLYTRYRYQKESPKVIKYAALFALSLFLAFNTKGTIILLLPLYLFLFIQDFNCKNHRNFWLYSFGFGFGLLALYTLGTYLLSGVFGQRFIAISSNAYLNHCSYGDQSIHILLKRIGYELLFLLQREGALFAYLFVFFGVLKTSIINTIKRNDTFHYYLFAALVLMLSANFMSISLFSYNPMCLDARHYLFLLPVGAIAAAKSFPLIQKSFKSNILLFLLIGLLSVISFLDGSNKYQTFFLPVFLLIIFSSRFFSKWQQSINAIGLSCLLLIQLIPSIQYAQDVQYRKQEKEIKLALNKIDEGIVVCNTVQKRIAKYYNGFIKNDKIRFISYQDFNSKTDTAKNIYLLKNPHFRNLQFLEENDLPFYAQHTNDVAQLLFESKETGIQLFHLIKIRQPDINGLLLFESLQNFESEKIYWNKVEEFIQNDIVAEGRYAQLVPEYSSTFVFPIDSLKQKANGLIYIECTADVWVADQTKASLVISIETKENNILYVNKAIVDFIPSFSNWWEAKVKASIDWSSIPKGAVLKSYLYNPDLNSIYLDNYKVSIYQIP